MVLGVCRRVLVDADESDDAFQATFLVLVRRAGSISKPELLGNWLYGVAYRVASKARAAGLKRQAKERLADVKTTEAADEPQWRELSPVLDEELQRLPEKYRVPLVLCYLEGKTYTEAAQLLELAEGTVSGRLARARELLRHRLTRRGVTLSSTVLAQLVVQHATTAAVSATLMQTTLQASVAFAAGKALTGTISTLTVSLTSEILQAMFLAKAKVVLGWVLAAIALVGGTGFVVHNSLEAISDTRQETRNAREIDSLSLTLQAFYAEYGFYPPSRMKLYADETRFEKIALDNDSRMYIKRMFPRVRWKGLDWGGNDGAILSGDQCLVFFLGGITDEGGCRGFSTNPTNPTQKGGSRTPTYDFEPSRLIRGSNGYYSYRDVFGEQPYAFFSTHNTRNGYNRFGSSDCQSLDVWPYVESLIPTTQYWKPDTFQIISAGADRQFGSGSALPDRKTWTPQSARTIDPPGRDDQTNFHKRPLGRE